MEPGVFDGERCLVRQGDGRPNLLVRECLRLCIVQGEAVLYLPLDDQGYGQERLVVLADDLQPLAVLGIAPQAGTVLCLPQVGDGVGLAGVNGLLYPGGVIRNGAGAGQLLRQSRTRLDRDQLSLPRDPVEDCRAGTHQSIRLSDDIVQHLVQGAVRVDHSQDIAQCLGYPAPPLDLVCPLLDLAFELAAAGLDASDSLPVEDRAPDHKSAE